MNNEDRYILIEQSIKDSFKEMKLIQENKLPKKTWDDFFKEVKSK